MAETATERAFMAVLRKWGSPLSAATLGNEVWGRQTRKPQHWCRPAGAVLHRMERKGLVCHHITRHGIRWVAIREGRNG